MLRGRTSVLFPRASARRIDAMKRACGFSRVAAACAACATAACLSRADSTVMFNEIMYHPAGDETALEWVELHNAMAVDMDISGWSLAGGIWFEFPEGSVVPGSGFAVIAIDPAALAAAAGIAAPAGPFEGRLENAGERLDLLNNNGRLMDSVAYLDREPWPVAADGSGASLAKLRPASASGEPGNWAPSAAPGGTPGKANFEEGAAPAAPTLRFNETALAGDGAPWIELAAVAPCQALGTAIESSAGQYYILSSAALAAGTRLVFSAAALGFEPRAGEKLFLRSPDGETILDAVWLAPGLQCRLPEGTGPWFAPEAATPGAANAVARCEDLVVNEIMYHPMLDEGERGEYVELYNRGAAVLDLSGFRFTDGIAFQFPEGTMLGPGAYLVVARDPAYVRETYGIDNVAGPASGALANDGERIAIADARGNLADEVRYFEGERWPAYADGGGSSLELRDPAADNAAAEAWAASDESGKSRWRTYSYSGVAAADRGPTRWREFVMGLLDAGEILIDDVSVLKRPSTAPAEILQNVTFTDGPLKWRLLGTHRLSRGQDDPLDPAEKVLRLVATGPTEHMHNHAETTLKGTETVLNGTEYGISFRAKWLAGSNLLNTRLYFSRLARTTALDVPAARGTPGARNTARVDNMGPTFAAFGHSPAVPNAAEEALVTARPEDPDGVAGCTLAWAVNGGAWQRAAMDKGADGAYRGTIPGQLAAAIVQFYVEAEDGRGAASMFPARGPNSRALYKVKDGQARLGTLHNVRIVMLPADATLLHTPTNVMSNEHLGATIIYDEREVFYDAGVRLKSSERGRLATTRVGFSIRFNGDRLFRGVHRTIGIDRSGGLMFSRTFGQDEICVKHIVNHAGGMAGMYDDLTWVIAPRPEHTSTALLLMARFNDVFLDSQWPRGGDGMLYTYELIYYPTTTVDGTQEGLKLPQPDEVIGVDIQNLGDDKELYRWFFLIENNRARDDYAGLMRFCKNFAAPSDVLEARAAEIMDVDQWMRTFAMYSLCGIGDTYTQGLYHNNMYYVRPEDGRVLVFPWDMDFAFVRSTSEALWGNANLARIIALPAYTRLFYRHLQDIIATTYNRAYMERWTTHYGALCSQDFRPIAGYIATRAAFVASRIPAGIAFEIATNDGEDFSVETASATIEGKGPIDMYGLALNDAPVAPRWRTATRWAVDAPLAPGPNRLVFSALDGRGTPMATDAVTVTSTLDWHPPEVFMFSPLQGPAAGGTKVQIYGDAFQPGMRVRFGGAESPAVTVLAAAIAEAVTPPGTGTVAVEVENPDGLAAVAPAGFAYVGESARFVRGDANADGRIDVADGIGILQFLFASGALGCEDAGDVNDDGALNIGDAISLLSYVFAQGAAPPPPHGACGIDPTPDALGCESFAGCR